MGNNKIVKTHDGKLVVPDRTKVKCSEFAQQIVSHRG